MDTTVEKKVIFKNKFAEVTMLDEQGTLLCKTLTNYIPIDDFQKLFHELTGFIKTHFVKKFIFDKRTLTIFHQPSMEWYHTVWKREMLKYNLSTYRKILPNDKFFRMSVEIGKNKIVEKYPDYKPSLYDIQYCESVEEAMKI